MIICGNVIERIEDAFLNLFKDDFDNGTTGLNQISDLSIRPYRDRSVELSRPALIINVAVDQPIAKSWEYHAVVQIMAETMSSKDKDRDICKRIIGLVRELVLQDSLPTDPNHFVGDRVGMRFRLNEYRQGVVFHEVNEAQTFDDDSGQKNSMVMNLDAYLYAGFENWNPSLATQLLWLDASDVATIISDTDKTVSTWQDKSGNSLNALNTSTDPKTAQEKLNGLNVLSFTDDFMTSSPVSTNSGTLNIIMVARVDTVDSILDSIFAFSGSGGEWNFRADNVSQFDGEFDVVGSFTASSFDLTGGPHNGPSLFGLQFDFASNTITAFIDGDSKGSVNDYTVALGSLTAMRLFSQSTTLNKIVSGIIGEVVLFPEVDTATREQYEGYLAHKWGLEANLPAGHTYKTAAP